MASSLRQHARTHSTPSNMLSFSCESHNQDVVPCGMAALDQLESLAKNPVEMTKIGLFCADRAFHLRYQLNLPEDLHLNCWPKVSPNMTLSRFCLT